MALESWGILPHSWSGKQGSCSAGMARKVLFPPVRGFLQVCRAACSCGLMQWEQGVMSVECCCRWTSPCGSWTSVTSWRTGSCHGWPCAARVSATSSWHWRGGNATAADPEGSTPASILGCCRTGSPLVLAGRVVISDTERICHCSVRIAELCPMAPGCGSSRGRCSEASLKKLLETTTAGCNSCLVLLLFYNTGSQSWGNR